MVVGLFCAVITEIRNRSFLRKGPFIFYEIGGGGGLVGLRGGGAMKKNWP